VIVLTPLLLLRQVVLTLLRPIALQTLPIVQGEKAEMPWEVDGFMMYFWPASQVLEESGQHCDALTACELAHVCDVQSCTAPKVWPVSCAMICHSDAPCALMTTFAPDTVSVWLPLVWPFPVVLLFEV